MPKFRTKLVEIEAVQWTGQNLGEAKEFLGADFYSAHDNGIIAVRSREGTVLGEPGYWLMRGTEGEHYLCADSVFQKKYERVNEPVSA